MIVYIYIYISIYIFDASSTNVLHIVWPVVVATNDEDHVT